MSCLYPFYVDNPRIGSKDRQVPVPCGKCPDCLKRRSDHWIFRIKQHLKVSKSAMFLTLTYSPEHCPISKNGFMTLDRDDLTKFWKRLRKAHGKGHSVKFYAVGEYGSKFERPHYHAILFNAKVEKVLDCWQFGKVDIDEVTTGSIAYVAKYLDKGRIVPKHRNDDRLKEFSSMSRYLGVNYLSPEVVKYHKADISRNYVMVDGFKMSMPRYYREKIFNNEEREKQQVIIEKNVNQAEDQRRAEYKAVHGTLQGYFRDVKEAKKARIVNFREKAKAKRKKL